MCGFTIFLLSTATLFSLWLLFQAHTKGDEE